jgi:hypothetical protein
MTTPQKSFHYIKMFGFIQNSRGASSDPINTYSTTSSTTHTNWLPVLQTNFKLHINAKNQNELITKEKQYVAGKSKSLCTGYSKNCSPFVPYDMHVDELEIKFEF